MTTTFEVAGMSCGHCVRAITEALQAADPGVKVSIDLASRRVQVEPSPGMGVDALADAIREAGYSPVPQDAV